jgi:hypothetical protein
MNRFYFQPATILVMKVTTNHWLLLLKQKYGEEQS